MRCFFFAASTIFLLTICRLLDAQPLTSPEVLDVLKSSPARAQFNLCLQEPDKPRQFELQIEISPDGKASLVDIHPEIKAGIALCMDYAIKKYSFRETGKHYRAAYSIRLPFGLPSKKNGRVEEKKKSMTMKELKREQVKYHNMNSAGIVIAFLGGSAALLGSFLYVMGIAELVGHMFDNEYRKNTDLFHTTPLILGVCGPVAFIVGIALVLASKKNRDALEIEEYYLRRPELVATVAPDGSGATAALRWHF